MSYLANKNHNKTINKTPLYGLAILLLSCYFIISVTLYHQMKKTTIDSELNDLQNHILFQKSMQFYINNKIKPVIYEFQKQKKISRDYFNPQILSGTYITRNIFQLFNKKLESNEQFSWQYRLAASNARNPLNQATPEELKLLKKFNQDRTLQYVNQIKTIDGQEFLYFAAPFKPNNASCLRCHGDPKSAPKELLDRYGNVNGFHEKIGDIRAFTTYQLKLSEIMKTHNKSFIIISFILFLFLLLLYALVSWVYLTEQRKKQLIAKQKAELEYIANHDFLTKLKNRHALNQDFSIILKQLKNAPAHLSNLWIMMLDIDFFKKINDDFGHDTGDLVLQKLGEILLQEIQNFEYADAYRLGGEEFLVIIRNTDAQIVQKLYEDIANSLLLADIPALKREIKISGGATKALLTQDHQYDILKRADNALYLAKQQGRERLVFDS
ncbi:diguanylate cyclase [Thiomicrorhabdus sp. Milos-T2]|uniref:diguanylate cyclase n=1 Tax=Thiomicrorhabdus sp. Milos-T2 TaxID=90814 RepID=UPI0004949D58|nr:diguanylate cyclase [Thiomicrorhabdus sp. Milos-T2]